MNLPTSPPARIGKIARLPAPIREQLNTRLHNGEPASTVLPWLNGLPEVRAVLAARFNARPINAPNLTAWRHGGFADWLLQHQSRALLRDLHQEIGDAPVSQWLAAPLAVTLGRCLQQFDARSPNSSAQRDALLALTSAITRLRRCDLVASRLRFETDRWQLDQSLLHPSHPPRQSNPVKPT